MPVAARSAPSVARLHLPRVRLASADLWQPTALPGRREVRFRSTLILDMSDADALARAAALLEACHTLWERAAGPGQKPPRMPVTPGDDFRRDGRVLDGFSGNLVVKTSSKDRPTLIGPKGAELAMDDGSLYAGAWAHAIIRLTAFSTGGSPGVHAQLLGLRFVAHDKPIGWSPRASGALTAEDFSEAPRAVH